jgi:hypothetical protein
MEENGFFYAASHPYAHGFNILQHTPCGEIRVSHMEMGAKSNADGKMHCGTQTVMWQLKKFHTAKRKHPYTKASPKHSH